MRAKLSIIPTVQAGTSGNGRKPHTTLNIEFFFFFFFYMGLLAAYATSLYGANPLFHTKTNPCRAKRRT